MRTSRIFRPLPAGKGLFVRGLSAVLLTALIAAVPAHAGNVTVGFGLSAGAYAPTGGTCPVSVPLGSDGEVVLQAAKTKGCISSYKTVEFPPHGSFVSCINDVCGQPSGFELTYWKFYENGKPATHGIDGFSARPGSEIVFAYTTWAGCVVATQDPVC